MEAANRGAQEAGGRSIGFSLVLLAEQLPNGYITPELCFPFHYFANRNTHFLMRARALVAFLGGFGALDFLTSGYAMTVDEVVRDALFSEDAKEMVVVRDIEFYSLCEHHLLPFFGRAHVAYLPNGQVIGLSKIARVVDVFARRLQVQERLTNQIADALLKTLQAQGGDGGQSHLHDDAGRAEAEQQHRHERDARKLRDQRTHAQ